MRLSLVSFHICSCFRVSRYCFFFHYICYQITEDAIIAALLFNVRLVILEGYVNGLVKERRNSIANALELRLSCTKSTMSRVVGSNPTSHPHTNGSSVMVTHETLMLCHTFFSIYHKSKLILFSCVHTTQLLINSCKSWIHAPHRCLTGAEGTEGCPNTSEINRSMVLRMNTLKASLNITMTS